MTGGRLNDADADADADVVIEAEDASRLVIAVFSEKDNDVIWIIIY